MKLACATDNEREGNKVSMGVILAEIQSSENREDTTSCSQAGPPVEGKGHKQNQYNFHPKFVLSTRNAGKKMEQRMREWPNYTLPNLRPIPLASSNP